MKRLNRHVWLLDPLLDEPGTVVRPMFGCQSCYFNGLLVLVLADGEEPWRGVLVPTEHAAHCELRRLFPALAPHPVLPKWLYLPEDAPGFERDAQEIVRRIRLLDPLIGVLPENKRPSPPQSPRTRQKPPPDN
jgi:hypothetical protein